ncbi:MAG TPA: type VII secretion-associated protein [Pseudonocardiaceae bacterium]|nr:type VII secretion-associated protein [Pseudonocardiaceae bacterium]
MTLRVAVDFGTTSTCVVVSVNGGEPQVVMVEGGSPVMPSAVFAAADGTLFVGQEAERQAAIDPARYEPNPKRRIDEGELLLGNSVLPVVDVVRAVLSRAVGEARRVAGGAPVDLLVLTHPADWGAVRTRVLRQAGNGLGTDIVLVPEPVAAAVFHAARHGLGQGASIAVLDVGGGTVDVSVVRKETSGFQVLATHGDPNFGGADIDQLLLDHIGATFHGQEQSDWQALMSGQDMSDRRRRRMLRQDVRGAKETLSRHTYTDVPLPPPFPDAHVTRADLEKLLAEPLGRAAALTAGTIASAGLRPEQLAAVFLVGGSSRIPLIARLVRERTGVLPTTLDAPETVVCRGALRAVAVDPLRTGPTQRPALGPAQRPVAQRMPPPLASPHSPPHSSPRSPQPVYRQPGPPALAPAPGPAKRSRRGLYTAIGAVAVIAVAVAGVLVFVHPFSSAAPPAGKVIAEYDYRFTAPADWAQSGGSDAQLEVQVAPGGSASSPQSIYVAEFRLNYDSTSNRTLAVSQLRQLVDNNGYRDFNSQLNYASRTVVYYRESHGSSTVDWYVLFQGKVQVSVGCAYPNGGAAAIDAACKQVVGGMTITG